MKVKDIGSWCILEEYVKDNSFARFHTHSYHCCSEMHLSSRLDMKSMEREMSVKGTWSWRVLEECVKDNNYGRFHTRSFHCCRDMHFNS